jgi:CMP-N,N'-diacetyllegionaminic acid synthase
MTSINNLKEETISIICARGESKGIKNKNLIKINKKSLLFHAINKIKKNNFHYICLSTDSKKIQNEAKKFGIESFFLRPLILSGSNISKFDVWRHAIIKSEKYYKKKFKYMIDVDVSNPLTNYTDLRNFINFFNRIKYKYMGLFCGMNSKKNPYFNILKKKNNYFSPVINSGKKSILSRQRAPKTIDHVAAFYYFKVDFVKKANNFMQGPLSMFYLPYEKSIDIDNIEDYKVVKKLMSY